EYLSPPATYGKVRRLSRSLKVSSNRHIPLSDSPVARCSAALAAKIDKKVLRQRHASRLESASFASSTGWSSVGWRAKVSIGFKTPATFCANYGSEPAPP